LPWARPPLDAASRRRSALMSAKPRSCLAMHLEFFEVLGDSERHSRYQE
jgi:hypothetical protein